MSKIFKDEQLKTKRIIISDDIKDIVYARSNGRCFYCGKKLKKEEMSIEHFIPLNCSGSNDIKNLYCSCKKCNQEKGNNILMKHIIAMENFIHEQNEVINSKKDLIGKILNVFEQEVGQKIPLNSNIGDQVNEEELKKKNQEINALKSERAKLLKDIKKLKDNEDTKNKAHIVVKKEEYEIKIKELENKVNEKNKELVKKDKEIRMKDKEIKSQQIINDRLKKQRDKKKLEAENKKKQEENLKILEGIRKKQAEQSKNLQHFMKNKH